MTGAVSRKDKYTDMFQNAYIGSNKADRSYCYRRLLVIEGIEAIKPKYKPHLYNDKIYRNQYFKKGCERPRSQS